MTLLLGGNRESIGDLLDRLRDEQARDVATTIITYEEQTRGWMAYKARARQLELEIRAYAKLKSHLESYRSIHVLPFDEEAARELQRLQQLRLKIGGMDLRIASIAIARDATLLTRNLSHFRQVPGLRSQDWLST